MAPPHRSNTAPNGTRLLGIRIPIRAGRYRSGRTAASTRQRALKVFRAESEEHAGRIAKSVIGKALRDIPLKLVDVQAQ